MGCASRLPAVWRRESTTSPHDGTVLWLFLLTRNSVKEPDTDHRADNTGEQQNGDVLSRKVLAFHVVANG
jgi:hypothetical protein